MLQARCKDCRSSNIELSSQSTFGKPGEYYYEFHEGHTNKFWGIRIDNLRVYTRFGRMGSEGQQTIKDFRFYSEARDYISKKRNEKQHSGYERVY